MTLGAIILPILYRELDKFREKKLKKEELRKSTSLALRKSLKRIIFEWEDLDLKAGTMSYDGALCLADDTADVLITIAVELDGSINEETIDGLRNLAKEFRILKNRTLFGIGGDGEEEFQKKGLELVRRLKKVS